MIVATVLRSGGHYAVDYVEHLQAGLAAHTPQAELVCLSDVPVPCTRIPLVHDWPGWWAKIELFRPGLFGADPVLYLDLDTLIVGNIAPLACRTFTALADFFQPTRGIGSGVMSWAGDYSHLYQRFLREPAKWQALCTRRGCWGDQGYIHRHQSSERFQTRFPDLIQSVKQPGPRERARLLCFHGQPKPRDVGWQPPATVYDHTRHAPPKARTRIAA